MCYWNILADGWAITPVVGLEEHGRGGGWRVGVHYLVLTKDAQALVMTVHSNPVCRTSSDTAVRNRAEVCQCYAA